MNKIQELKQKIESVNIQNDEVIKGLMDEAFEVFSKKMSSPKNRKTIRKMIQQVENSKDLTSVKYDEFFHQYTTVDFSLLINETDEFECNLLRLYFDSNDYFIYPDFKNNSLTISIGLCILINDDGDILDQDSGKLIFDSNDYLDENGDIDKKKRNQLIEKYMEENDYFPSVVECDYYGNAFYVNTKSED